MKLKSNFAKPRKGSAKFRKEYFVHFVSVVTRTFAWLCVTTLGVQTLCVQTLHAQSFETILQQGHELAVISVAVSPDSNYVATGSRDKSAKLWELSTGREVRSFLGHDYSVTSIDISSDGKYLL